MTSFGRLALVLAILGLPLGTGVAAAEQGSTERPFLAGGQVRMDLSAGDYTIQAGQGDRILVRWETRSSEDASKVKVAIDRQGSAATVRTRGPHNNFRVVIEVPARTDLHVDLSAGELRIRGISGNKDVGSWAGQIDIEIGHGEQYGTIDAAVKAGEITAGALNVSKGGLFRSFRWKGPGHDKLRVRLTAGELRLL